MNRKTVAQRALSLIDLTNLNEGCTSDDIKELCTRAQTPFGNTAAICILPFFVAQAKDLLKNIDIKIATVVNFPSGDSDVKSVMRESKICVANGADEIDLVMPYSAFKKGDIETAREMISTIRAVTDSQAKLKVIVEAGRLVDDALIAEASKLALEEGADFIKTSTGKVDINATLENAKIILDAIKEFGDLSRGFKAAGGIRTVEDCGAYLALADEIFGQGWVTKDTFRFGASRGFEDVLAALEGREVGPQEGY